VFTGLAAGYCAGATSGASLADLKARMGHDSARAAMIYQHATEEADQAIDSLRISRGAQAPDAHKQRSRPAR
jgi:hypothetical protein